MDKSKLAMSAAFTDRLLKILQLFMLALIIVSAVFILLTFILGKKAVSDPSVLTLAGIDIRFDKVNGAYLDEFLLKISVMASQMMKILTFGVIWLALRVMRRILAPIKAGSPLT